jgi:N-acylglucosamine-6-phosphate 2-epimerase
MNPIFERLRSGLIVSCQAYVGEPTFGASMMVAFARSAAQGGAVGIRANSPADITAIRAVVDLPVIGLYKIDLPGFAVRITPTLEAAKEVAKAGAHIIAVDATQRPHPDGLPVDEWIRMVKHAVNLPLLADVATYTEGLAAQAAGAEAVSTTLSGYTAQGPTVDEPDFDLLARLVGGLRIPVFAEGRIGTPQQAERALELGAFAVVVGSAITRPWWITEQFVKSMERL